MPRIIAGSSAGAMICAMICSRPYDKMYELNDFEVSNPMPSLGWLTKSHYETLCFILQGKPFLCSKTLETYVKHFTGDKTFLDIYE
jgi:predicted acylesterase/phospholipase RssA